MREKNPQMLVIIDPVLDDDDSGFYADPELARHYREQLAPLAIGLTPNYFELGCLCNARLESDGEILDDARYSMQVFCVTAKETFGTEHPPKGTGDLFTAGRRRGVPLNLIKRQSRLACSPSGSVLATRTLGRCEQQLAGVKTV